MNRITRPQRPWELQGWPKRSEGGPWPSSWESPPFPLSSWNTRPLSLWNSPARPTRATPYLVTLAFRDGLHCVYGVCFLPEPSFTWPRLALEFLPARSQDPTLGGHPRDSAVTWDVTTRSRPTLFPVTPPCIRLVLSWLSSSEGKLPWVGIIRQRFRRRQTARGGECPAGLRLKPDCRAIRDGCLVATSGWPLGAASRSLTTQVWCKGFCQQPGSLGKGPGLQRRPQPTGSLQTGETLQRELNLDVPGFLACGNWNNTFVLFEVTKFMVICLTITQLQLHTAYGNFSE